MSAGILMYSANAPSMSTPMIFTRSQMCASPVRHIKQSPHEMCPSAETRSPTLTELTASPTAATTPMNS